MAEPTEIEKKSLEAHVELCAERYNSLDERIDNINKKVGAVEKIVSEVRDMIHAMTEKRSNQLITWGVGIIAFLVGTIGWLLSSYVFK
jgi:prefoldin subunit 5